MILATLPFRRWTRKIEINYRPFARERIKSERKVKEKIHYGVAERVIVVVTAFFLSSITPSKLGTSFAHSRYKICFYQARKLQTLGDLFSQRFSFRYNLSMTVAIAQIAKTWYFQKNNYEIQIFFFHSID